MKEIVYNKKKMVDNTTTGIKLNKAIKLYHRGYNVFKNI